MRILEADLAPVGLDELTEHYHDGKCLVVEGNSNKFEGLVTLDDIERRLNDGANSNAFPQAIIDGTRKTMINSNSPWSSAC